MRHRAFLTFACGALVLLAACSTPADDAAAVNADSPAPLTELPPCQDPPPPSGDDVPPGAVLPPDSVVLGTTEQGPLTTVTGYVAMTPIGIRLDYQERDGEDVEILIIEDEVFEVELLVSTGPQRMFLKGRAICEQGTEFQAVVAPEVDAEGLPVPAGTEGPQDAG